MAWQDRMSIYAFLRWIVLSARHNVEFVNGRGRMQVIFAYVQTMTVFHHRTECAELGHNIFPRKCVCIVSVSVDITLSCCFASACLFIMELHSSAAFSHPKQS